jgi:flagellin-like hook-associated protein FlgL
MAVNNVTLSASSRSNLLALQGTANLIGRTQSRLSTGLAVQSPVDDAFKYFQAKSLSSRAQDLNERKESIDQGISALEATLKATTAIEDIVQRMKGMVDAARSQTATERAATGKQLGELNKQISKLILDATYKGLNLINSSSSELSVRFSDKADSKLEVCGVNFNVSVNLFRSESGTSGLGVAASEGSNFVTGVLGFASALSAFLEFSDATLLASFNEVADTAILRLEKTISNVRAKALAFANNNDLLKIRLDFTKDYGNTLKEGSDKLTLADLNEEGANLLALQTRQQIGIQALSFAGQSEQAVLSLFR